MPYTIPSSVISPGSVYQPRQIPAVVSQNARALYYTRSGSTSSSLLLDQSSLNSGTRRTGEEGRCYTADGTDDEVNFGDIGSAIWFSGWVRLNSDNQCLFSLSNDTNTNLIVSAGVLTAGATLTLTGIKIDDVSKTASEAGVLLNDNAWHFLSCGIGDGLGGASTADDVRFFTDGTAHGSVSGFDWRFWSTAPTAAELTEAYSGNSLNRNSAALSKYALWAKCDEQSGTTAYDSSGNGLTGTLANIAGATFHSTQDIWSFQNQVGYNKRMYFDGVNDYVNIGNSSTLNIGVSDFVLQASFLTNLSGVYQRIIDKRGSSSGYTLGISNSNVVFVEINDGSGNTGYAGNTVVTDENIHLVRVEANRDGNLLIFLDGNLDATHDISAKNGNANSSSDVWIGVDAPSGGYLYFKGLIYDLLININGSDVALINGYGNTDADWIDQIGSNNGTVNGSPSNILLPRDESDPTNDVLGNPLTNTGRRPNDAALHSSNCLTADGTLYIAAAHLAGTETVVSSGGTSTPSISAGRIDFTAGTCWDLTLSDGTHYKLAEGYGTAILDASGNGNHGVLTSAVLANAWGATQNVYHSNLIDGSGKRMWFDGASNYVDLANLYLLLNPSSFSMTIKEFYLASASITIRSIIFSTRLSASGLNIAVSNAYNFQIFEGGLPLGAFTSYTVPQKQKIKLQVSINGTIAKLFIDNVFIEEITLSSGCTISLKSEIGAFSASSIYYFNGALSGISFFSDDAFSNSIAVYDGYGNTDSDWIDITGNGNDGTVVGSPEAFYIPAAPDGLDVFGNELTEKPSDIVRNRAETLIDLDPDSTPEMGATQLGITVPASHAFGDAFAASDQIFSRQRTLTEDRFVVMPEAQTGSALATIQRYTQP